MMIKGWQRASLITGSDVLKLGQFPLLASRLLLAAVFLLAGSTKLVDPIGLRNVLRDFGLPPMLARPAVLLLPILELAVAAALTIASFAWYGACGAVALLTVLCVAVGVALFYGRQPACHCFGQLYSARVGWPTVIRNTVLAALAAWIISKGRLHSEPELWTWLVSLDIYERKVAIVIGCAAAFGFFYVLDRTRSGNTAIGLPPIPTAYKNMPEEQPAPSQRKASAPAVAAVPRRAKVTPRGIGLPIGASAPEFELPDITGKRRSLQSLRDEGTDILLVFSSPFCDSCAILASNLVRWMREMDGLPSVVLVTSGSAQDNAAKLQGFEPSRILLQRNLEVSEAYDGDRTPTAVLVDADGLIRSGLVVGGDAIKALLASYATRGVSEAPVRIEDPS